MKLSNPLSVAVKIVLAYAAFSILWILLSDQFLFIFLHDAEKITKLQTFKDGFFVIATSLILFLFIFKETNRYDQIKNSLEEHGKQITLAMQASKTGIWSWDMKTNKMIWSDENYILLGYEPGAIESNYENWEKCVHKDDLENVRKCINNTIKTKSGLDFEHRTVLPDGTIRWLQSIGEMVFGRGGETIGMYGIQIDITKRKRNEEEEKRLNNQLRQTQKMKAIGSLASGIAHDFNNILTPIIGYTEIVIAQFPKESIVYSDLQEVLKAALRARKLVKQILSFSRQTEKEKRPIHIHLMVKEALQLLRPTISANIEINENIHLENSLVVADPTQIHQIVLNICTNACHAMQEKGGEMRVSVSKVEVPYGNEITSSLELAPGSYILLEVRDTGHGMDSNTLEKIFDPYFTTKGKYQGAGLALFVVHGIVESIKGGIRVRSQPEIGTIFSIYLPELKEDIAWKFDKKMEYFPRGTEQILLVENDQAIAQMEQRILEDLGYNVKMTTSSPDALDIFRADPDRFDLIITDMYMPSLSGDVFAQKVLSLRPDTPVILCAEFSDRINIEVAKSIGISDFIMKPVLKDDLAKLVRKVLNAR